jgi:hypothetical protein
MARFLAMVTIDCPWCATPVALDSADVVRCDECSVQVELAVEVTDEVALAA